MTDFIFKTLAQVKRVITVIVGFTLLLIGVAMIFLPGPAVVVVPLALTILASEFYWARKLLKIAKERLTPNSRKQSNPEKENKPDA